MRSPTKTPSPLPDDTTLAQRKDTARAWFESLRDRICAEFERIEDELSGTHRELPPGRFERKAWQREAGPEGEDRGGGMMSIMRGRVFEKVGVNVSTVFGEFSPEFRKQIPGAEPGSALLRHGHLAGGPHALAQGAGGAHEHALSSSPRTPGSAAAPTSRRWCRTTPTPRPSTPRSRPPATPTTPAYYPRFKKWCDEYFYLPHRGEARGVGGIFYDYLDSGDFARDFAFTRAVGEAFLDVYPRLVRRHMNEPWTAAEREHQLVRRGRYVEFNLLYDRGTKFGLMTGGNVEAILMSLPPEARWP